MVEVGPLPRWLVIQVLLLHLGTHQRGGDGGQGALQDRLQFGGGSGDGPLTAHHGGDGLVDGGVGEHLSLT